MVFPSNFQGSGFSFKFLKYYPNLMIFRVILNFSPECYYLENKVEVVDFTKACGLVKFQSPWVLVGPWASNHFQSLDVCKIYYSHFIFEVMYHSKSKRTLITLAILCKKNLQSLPSFFSNCFDNKAIFAFMNT